MRLALYSYLFVAAGGAIGAMARFGLNVFLQRDVEFPWGTLVANLLGCLVMGITKLPMPPNARKKSSMFIFSTRPS